MKKKLLSLLPFICLLVGCSNTNNSASKQLTDKEIYEAYKPVTFNSSNIILRAPIFSDEHCERTDPIDSSAVAAQNIARFTNLVGRTSFDVWLSAGDRSLTGTIDADEKWYNAYKNGCADSVNHLFFCHGNHDVYWSGCATRQEHYNWFNSKGIYSIDSNDGQPATGNRHAVINGIDFVAIDFQSYGNHYSPFSDATKTWANNLLTSISQNKPNKPIFLLAHCSATDTAIGSWANEYDGYWGSSDDLKTLCNQYPNVVLLNGHTHYDCYSERDIWQGNFTAISIPTLAGGMTLDTYFNGLRDGAAGSISGYSSTAEQYNNSQCLYLEIDNNYNSRITRYDLCYQRTIGQPWIIPAPKADKSHLIPYSIGYIASKNTAPSLSQGESDFIVYSHSDGTLEAKWNAFTDDTSVYAYELQLFNGNNRYGITPKSTPTEKILFYPDWFKESGAQATYTKTFSTNVSRGSTFVVRIIAFDTHYAYTVEYPHTVFYLP